MEILRYFKLKYGFGGGGEGEVGGNASAIAKTAIRIPSLNWAFYDVNSGTTHYGLRGSPALAQASCASHGSIIFRYYFHLICTSL